MRGFSFDLLNTSLGVVTGMGLRLGTLFLKSGTGGGVYLGCIGASLTFETEIGQTLFWNENYCGEGGGLGCSSLPVLLMKSGL